MEVNCPLYCPLYCPLCCPLLSSIVLYRGTHSVDILLAYSLVGWRLVALRAASAAVALGCSVLLPLLRLRLLLAIGRCCSCCCIGSK